MVYSLGWGMGEPERRALDRKRAQPVAHSLSLDDGHEVDVLPLHNQVTIPPLHTLLTLSSQLIKLTQSLLWLKKLGTVI